MDGWTILGAAVISIVAFVLISGFLKTWSLYRGVHVITCPENHEPAAVRVAALDAARTFAVTGETRFHLHACSRWPELQGCDEACRAEIHDSPTACSLQTIVASWYEGKQCHFCAKPIGAIVWHERPPAVTLADGQIHEWKDLPPEQLPKIFATGQPVCWSCSLVETFCNSHPDLLVQRVHLPPPHHALPPSTATY